MGGEERRILGWEERGEYQDWRRRQENIRIGGEDRRILG